MGKSLRNRHFADRDVHVFLLTLIAAILCNIQYVCNELSYADVNTFSEHRISNYWELSLGRWVLPYIDHVRWGIAGSVITSIMASFWLAISAVLLIKIFSLRSKISAIFVCLLLAVAPFFYDILGSYHCSAEYMLGFSLSILCAYITDRFKNIYGRVLFGGIALGISLGIYQAYLGVTCGLCIVILLQSILESQTTFYEVRKKIFVDIAMGIWGIIFYFIGLFINLRLWNWHMESYSGANQIGISTIFGIPGLMKDALHSFYKYFFTNDIVNNSSYHREQWNMIFFILIAILLVVIWIDKNGNIKNRIKMACISIILILLLPFALGVIELIIPNRDINQIMSAPYIVVYIFAIKIFDIFLRNKSKKRLSSVALGLIMAIIIQSYWVMDNASYMATKMTVNKQKFIAMNVLNTLSETTGYHEGAEVLFVGTASNNMSNNASDIYSMASGTTASSGQIWSAPSLVNNNWYHFIRYQLGVELNLNQDTDMYMAIVGTTEFSNMPTYPEKGYIDMIDGVWVVKLESNPDKE